MSSINSWSVNLTRPAIISGSGSNGILTFQRPLWIAKLVGPPAFSMNGMVFSIPSNVLNGEFEINAAGILTVPPSTSPSITLGLNQNVFSVGVGNFSILSTVLASATQPLTSDTTSPWSMSVSLWGGVGAGLQGRATINIAGSETETNVSYSTYNPAQTGPALQVSVDVLFSTQAQSEIFNITMTDFSLSA